MAEITYSPDSFVAVARTTLVARLLSVIVTPGTASPLVSMTVPLISPDGVWPRTGTAREKRRRKRMPEDRPCIEPPQTLSLITSSKYFLATAQLSLAVVPVRSSSTVHHPFQL